MVKYVCILLLLIAMSRSFAGESAPVRKDVKAEHVSLEKGIPNNLIFSMIQDRNGLLWFGTMFGLFRFDGREYKSYRYNPSDTNSLSNDDVTAIFEDRDRNLWLGTYNGGLNKYDPATGIFTRYIHNDNDAGSISANTIWDIDQDRSGALWIATNGGGLCRFTDGKFTVYKKDTASAGSISGDYIRTVAVDNSGNIWAGTFGSGVNKFDISKKIFSNYRFDSSGECRGCNFISSLFTDANGMVWIGNGSGNLFSFDSAGDKFVKFEIIKDAAESQNNRNVNSILGTGSDKLLLGTGNGLYEFDKSTGISTRLEISSEGIEKNMPVISVVKDMSGVLWISSYMNGLYKVSGVEEKFKTSLKGKNVLCVYEDREGILWAGTSRDGLFKSSDEGKNFVNAALNLKDRENNFSVNSLCGNAEGDLWVGTSAGLYSKHSSADLFELYKPRADTLSSRNILKVITGRDDNLWIGTDNGLNKLSPQSHSVRIYYHNDEPGSILDNTILSLYEDSQGRIWAGTYGGLNVLDASSDKFKHYIKDPGDSNSISNNYAFSFCEDGSGNFWIGTGGGLNKLNYENNSFVHFSEKDGLPNEVISGIESDPGEVLWLSTFRGISGFNTVEKIFKNYDAADGLSGNMFNNGCYFKNNKGTIFFGGVTGLNYFNPGDVIERNFKSPVIFTSITTFGSKQNEVDITNRKQINLNYDENTVRINFASIDYANPERNQYSYFLEGWDNNWVNNGNSNSVMYTNLGPGHYVFNVKGTNSDGVWNDRVAVFTIIIKPPFWKTWWFYGLIFISIISAIILIQNYRVRSRVKRLLEIETIRHHEREMMREQAARDYHDELGHKLTRISLYSRRIDKKLRATANGLTQDLNNIVETTNSLQSGAKDLIWAMNPNEDSLYDMIVRLKDFGNELFDDTGVSFSIAGLDEKMKSILLPMNLKRHIIFIFKEAMNNSLKHSHCSDVKMNLESDNAYLKISLSDNGSGFDIERKQSGYGIKNINSRAMQIKSVINIISEKNSGTQIILTIPISKLIKA